MLRTKAHSLASWRAQPGTLCGCATCPPRAAALLWKPEGDSGVSLCTGFWFIAPTAISNFLGALIHSFLSAFQFWPGRSELWEHSGTYFPEPLELFVSGSRPRWCGSLQSALRPESWDHREAYRLTELNFFHPDWQDKDRREEERNLKKLYRPWHSKLVDR